MHFGPVSKQKESGRWKNQKEHLHHKSKLKFRLTLNQISEISRCGNSTLNLESNEFLQNLKPKFLRGCERINFVTRSVCRHLSHVDRTMLAPVEFWHQVWHRLNCSLWQHARHRVWHQVWHWVWHQVCHHCSWCEEQADKRITSVVRVLNSGVLQRCPQWDLQHICLVPGSGYKYAKAGCTSDIKEGCFIYPPSSPLKELLPFCWPIIFFPEIVGIKVLLARVWNLE